MEWISAHYQPLSLLINTSVMLVWVFYAHLLLNNYRRRRKPKLLINQSIGKKQDSHCQVCNMSEEALYLTLVIARLEARECTWECEVTDFIERDDPQRSLLEKTLQGPLQAGEVKDLGTFRALIDRILCQHGQQESNHRQQDAMLQSLSINVIFEYSAEKRPVGACRHFNFCGKEHVFRLKPTSSDTERLFARKQRQQVSRWLNQYL